MTVHNTEHRIVEARIAFFDDYQNYQNVAMELADWSPITEEATATVFNDRRRLCYARADAAHPRHSRGPAAAETNRLKQGREMHQSMSKRRHAVSKSCIPIPIV